MGSGREGDCEEGGQSCRGEEGVMHRSGHVAEGVLRFVALWAAVPV